MPRDYSEEWERRVELAQERGWDSPYYEREARSFAYEMGADRENVEQYAHFFDDYSPGDMDISDWKEVYADIYDLDVGDFADWEGDFYDWLQEYYDNN